MRRVFWALLVCFVSINSFASDITLDFNVDANRQKPLLNVKTNLPTGTILTALLVNPTDQGGTGYFAQAQASVQPNHVVQFGPFSKNGERLAPGMYKVTVSTIGADLQPRDVQGFFGAHGEQLTGPEVHVVPGTSERLVSQRFQFTIAEDGSIGNPSREVQGDASAGVSSVIEGSCKGTLSESDGIQVLPSSGPVSTKDYLAVMKRAKASHLALGPDGFLWAKQPLTCDSATIAQIGDQVGRMRVTFSNGVANDAVLGFSGNLVGGDGPLLFSDTVYFKHQEPLSLNPEGNDRVCHFYFTDRLGFTEGWQHRRLESIQCELKLKNDAGHLISATVAFVPTP